MVICRVCLKTDDDDPRPMVRYTLSHAAHWECKLLPMTDTERRDFLRALPAWRLSQAPWRLLVDLELFDFAEGLLLRQLRR